MLRLAPFLFLLLLLGCRDSENQPTPSGDNDAPNFFIERKLGDYWYRSDTLSLALATLDTLRFTSTSTADSFIWTLNQRTYYGNPAIVVGWVGNRPAKLRVVRRQSNGSFRSDSTSWVPRYLFGSTYTYDRTTGQYTFTPSEMPIFGSFRGTWNGNPTPVTVSFVDTIFRDTTRNIRFELVLRNLPSGFPNVYLYPLEQASTMLWTATYKLSNKAIPHAAIFFCTGYPATGNLPELPEFKGRAYLTYANRNNIVIECSIFDRASSTWRFETFRGTRI